MADRMPLPGELYLDAILLDELRGAISQRDTNLDRSDFVRPEPFGDDCLRAAKERGRYVSLRWVLSTSVGIPLEPFTVWRRPAAKRERATPIPNLRRIGADTWWWDGLTEMLLIEVDLSSPATVHGLSRRDDDPVDIEVVTTGSGRVVLQAAPMLGVRVSPPGAMQAIRGLSVVTASNGDGWEPIERVGLPLNPEQLGRSYYAADPQGPLSALTDPVTAAEQRLRYWGPVLGWPALSGLPPWEAPDPARLVKEYGDTLVDDLVGVLAGNGPPDVDKQRLAEAPPRPLSQLIQRSLPTIDLNNGEPNYKSEMITRPLQAVATGVSSDAWASLALGFGTGAPIGQQSESRVGRGGVDDFMVTAPWRGMMEVAVPIDWPFPWADEFDIPPPPPVFVRKDVDRELAAIVLSPLARPAPGAPAPATPAINYLEGAFPVDHPYTAAVKVETPRLPALPDTTRVSGYAVARFHGPGQGSYRMRARTTAGGWVPLGTARPVRRPQDTPDPALTDNTVMLRDNGLVLPITAPQLSYQYAVAAGDLFGQWSTWTASWLTAGPADIQVPAVTVVRATPRPGPGNTDPCTAGVVAEIVWDASERTCSRLWLTVDVTAAPAPPQQIPDPPGAPVAPAATAIIDFDADGMPIGVPAGVTVAPLHKDDAPVTAADPWDTADGDDRRYRVTFAAVPVTYTGAREKLITVYVKGEETVRPGDWSPVWGHAKESVLAPNPIPPPPHVPPPVVYPRWASLPDAGGASYSPVEWSPTGAWGYRVFEATEAALLSACGRPGLVLTQGFGERMQTLFDLYAVPSNLAKLRAAYRKLGDAAVHPPVVNGKMRFDALLPRGSSLIHCYVVVGVTETNVISDWPVPDAIGRQGFLAYAIPHPVQPPQPQIRARLSASGIPELSVTVAGAAPITTIRLYRATNPVLARSVGTMARLPDSAPNPAGDTTVLADPAAPVGWDRLQYRAVVVTADDPDHAGMGLASVPSNPFALLCPPPEAPALTLSEVTDSASLTAAVVRVVTDAPAAPKQVGDHALAWVYRTASAAPVSRLRALPAIPTFGTLAGFIAGTASEGYVGGQLYLKLDRTGGEPVSVAVDVTDPLGRSRHALLDIPEFVPDPAPELTDVSVVRHTALLDRAVWFAVTTNVPLPPDPAHEWNGTVTYRRAIGITVQATFTFAISALPTITVVGDLPTPAVINAQHVVARIAGTGTIVGWFRATQPMRVRLAVANRAGQSASETRVTT
ncbi:hypothetical protein [Micromonospora sp. NPDC047074]|uniref:hypothetical protein n=1 Tax=Micromonospora sp. NPDC047074 TaxID=3154339 RepID=UPI0033CBFAEC